MVPVHPHHGWLTDTAGVFDARDEQREGVLNQIQLLHQVLGVEASVVTIPALPKQTDVSTR